MLGRRDSAPDDVTSAKEAVARQLAPIVGLERRVR
jgi:hypothetical protein